jgi:hypothetical protein
MFKMREETPMVALPESLAILRRDPIANDPMDQLCKALANSPVAIALALNLLGLRHRSMKIRVASPFTGETALL